VTELAVKAHELAKRYHRGRRAATATFGDTVAGITGRVLRRSVPAHRTSQDASIWALDGLSFEVQEGNVVGVIGRNGAGKTTLLKVLSGITEPTSGYAEVRGRVSSLLEVGTGFHQELTGRENVYLSGAILGMAKRRIDQRFDEIVDFAEVEDFLDTPVKFYSSGMFVRLGFAVAAFLDSDILFLDEVLAVGDYQFQQKSLNKMRGVGESGETVLFVSHNLAAIRAYCTSCVWIERGKVAFTGTADECVDRYLDAVSVLPTGLRLNVDPMPRAANEGEAIRFTEVALAPEHEDGKVRIGEALRVEIHFRASRPIDGLSVGFVVYTDTGTAVFQSMSSDAGSTYHLDAGAYTVEAVIPETFLTDGRYVIGLAARRKSEPLDWVRETVAFDVVDWATTDSWLEPRPWGIVRARCRFGLVRRTDHDDPPSDG
jgi:lipopolysaccharide transport system ATP-binding protein